MNKGIAEGMMDIALLTANSNQLRFIISYNLESKTYYLSLGLIITSLILQITVGFGLIYKNYNTKKKRNHRTSKTKQFLVSLIFMITVINVLAAAFTTTDKLSN
ncbi:Ninjurin-B [Pseudolycoriella hygida]|uniref:Ninjurin-B n=1 Tax=Pseudolycoriella hygida TaxID=35572 RepID=A0A9Q0NBF0_9DIPT|nr:Ninjurin-B [Pseudolycoriella hygida]